jgi:hypothetical protein
MIRNTSTSTSSSSNRVGYEQDQNVMRLNSLILMSDEDHFSAAVAYRLSLVSCSCSYHRQQHTFIHGFKCNCKKKTPLLFTG